MGMAILSSDEIEGSDVTGITGGVLGVAGKTEGAPSGMGSVGALMPAGISAGYGSSGCCGCGSSGCSRCSALYVVILVHLSRVNTSRQMCLRSS